MLRLNYKQQKYIIIFSFLFVPVALLLVFSYYPAIKLFDFSFSNWDGYSNSYNHIGFNNYIDLWNDKTALMTFGNNAAYLLVYLVQNIFSLYFALILNGSVRKRNFFKTAIFMPYILNGVAVAYMFSFMYSFNDGPINVLLRALTNGHFAIKWIGEGYYSNFSLGLIGFWRSLGFTMVLYLGAIQSISKELYEAADIDGANFLHKVKDIVLPGIKKVLELNLFMCLIGSMQTYFEPFVLTKGGPAGRTDTFVTSTLRIAFEFNNFGKASAMGVVLLIFAILIFIFQKKFLKEKDT
jgi:raffinose/stachyose/melibiose transport system permease protein